MPNTDNLNRTVFISDNLPFLQALDTESVDLIVIDPPFGKKQTFEGQLKPPLTSAERKRETELLNKWEVYDVNTAYDIGIEYPDQSGTTALFKDIWQFERVLEEDWYDRINDTSVWWLIESTRRTHGDSAAAYIAFMAQRIVEIRRVLKPTGSVYLHCDHSANAYLRQLMDAVFGVRNFRNEIVWNRAWGGKGSQHSPKRYGANHDTILYYAKSNAASVHPYQALTDEEIKERFPLISPDGRRYHNRGELYRRESQGPRPNLCYEFRGFHPRGKAGWRLSRKRMEEEYQRGNVVIEDGAIIRRVFSDQHKGYPMGDVWTDIPFLVGSANEITGYPTQKPQALARRIIEASSNPGDLVLDCFAGCAYVPVAAEQTGRRWMACDMSPRAWTVVRRQFAKQPDLTMTAESDDAEYDAAFPRFEGASSLKVRGPNQLPERSRDDAATEHLPIRAKLPQIRFRQKPLETSEAIWQAFVDAWGSECWYCGVRDQRGRLYLQLDHIVPKKGDGSNDDCWNRALACIACNNEKSNRLTPEQTIQKALESGRIETEMQRADVERRFNERHQWAIKRWKSLPKPKRFSALESPDADAE